MLPRDRKIMYQHLTIRSAYIEDASSIANIHLACWKTNYQNIISQVFLDSLKWQDRLENRQRIIREDPCIQLVALYEDRIVGFCDAGKLYFRKNQILSIEQQQKRDEPGEIYAIYISPEHQKKGIGKALFLETKEQLAQKNLIPFVVWTLKDNYVSRQFYEALGGKLVDVAEGTWGGQKCRLVAYRFE